MELRGLYDLTREELALLVREYLLDGHLIDRAGMPYLISTWGRDVMAQIAIDEWMGASPVYTKRMQRALGYEDDSVETMFKGLHFDIGSPPQFLDFRLKVIDHDNGEFWLDHCGALMDVEPMGEDYTFAMCHDIEDPTFDATAIATNSRMQVRPIHRPPRSPADRHPHCHWTVKIDDEHPELPVPAEAAHVGALEGASIELSPIDTSDEGWSAYDFTVLEDMVYAEWSRSALVRIAEEISLQGQLLALAFKAAVAKHTDDETQIADLLRKQFTGVAGLTAQRLKAHLGLGDSLDDLAQVLKLHPGLGPQQYVQAHIELGDRLLVRLPTSSPAVADGGWLSTVDADHLEPIDAIAWAIDPRFRGDVISDGDELVIEIVMADEPAGQPEPVTMANFSTGANWEFEDRGTPVQVRIG